MRSIILEHRLAAYFLWQQLHIENLGGGGRGGGGGGGGLFNIAVACVKDPDIIYNTTIYIGMYIIANIEFILTLPLYLLLPSSPTRHFSCAFQATYRPISLSLSLSLSTHTHTHTVNLR